MSGSEATAARRVVVYGDFNCPWSYLVSRRAALLAADGVEIDWRAVEHDPRRPTAYSDSSDRFPRLRGEIEKVLELLLVGEQLPYTLAGFVPQSAAAVAGYAEAHVAGVGAWVRPMLFDAFWLHAVDLGDPGVVHTLLVDAIRSRSLSTEPLRQWEYDAEATHTPLTSVAWRLRDRWASEWHASGKETVPMILVDGGDPIFGVDAVERLGAELLNRRLSNAFGRSSNGIRTSGLRGVVGSTSRSAAGS